MNRFLSIALTLVLLIAGATAFSGVTGLGLGIGAAQAQETIDKSRVQEMTMGNPDAKVTVIEYASFTCPHCKTFHATALQELKKNYIDTGKVFFIYREVYFDRFGLWAGMVARCGGESKYFGISDLIYEQQREWTAGGDPATIVGNLRKIGKTAGLTDDELDVCLSDGEMAQAMVAVYQENAKADDIDSTPSFVINGQKYNNMSYEDFAAILDEKLAE